MIYFFIYKIGKCMKNISSREAQNHFGELMIQVIKEPIIINRYGKPAAVLISHEEYENLASLKICIGQYKQRTQLKKVFIRKRK